MDITDTGQEDRIPTYLMVDAALRVCSQKAMPVYIINKGEKMGGMILLKTGTPSKGFRLLTRQRDFEGILQWQNALPDEISDEKDVDAYISRSIKTDPDLWVVEVQSPDFDNIFQN